MPAAGTTSVAVPRTRRDRELCRTYIARSAAYGLRHRGADVTWPPKPGIGCSAPASSGRP
eukprot:8142876-Alexandrium_andersonii.AAC.1